MAQNHGIRYRQQLKKCGFRGWRKANERRAELIDKDIYNHGDMTDGETRLLVDLQKLADLFLAWKFQQENYATRRRLRTMTRRLEATPDAAQ